MSESENSTVENKILPLSERPAAVLPSDKSEQEKNGTHLVDKEEDGFVLDSLEAFKTFNKTIAIIICIIFIMILVSCLANQSFLMAVLCLGGIIGTIYFCFLANLVLSWLRGVYRNTAILRDISRSLSSLKKQAETK